MLALIGDGKLIDTVASGHRITHEGVTVTPAIEGWVYGELSLVKISPADPVPEGKQIVSTGVEMVEGKPKYVHKLEDIPAPIVEPLTPSDVDAERDRRVDGGFYFNGVRFQSRPEDRENIVGASLAALAYLSSQKSIEETNEEHIEGETPPTDGSNEEGEAETVLVETPNYRWHGGDEDFVWIAENNSLIPMDAKTVVAFGQAAMAHKQALIFAARQLKDMDTIPEDYQDNRWWINEG